MWLLTGRPAVNPPGTCNERVRCLWEPGCCSTRLGEAFAKAGSCRPEKGAPPSNSKLRMQKPGLNVLVSGAIGSISFSPRTRGGVYAGAKPGTAPRSKPAAVSTPDPPQPIAPKSTAHSIPITAIRRGCCNVIRGCLLRGAGRNLTARSLPSHSNAIARRCEGMSMMCSGHIYVVGVRRASSHFGDLQSFATNHIHTPRTTERNANTQQSSRANLRV